MTSRDDHVRRRRLLAVSHPAVLSVNQLVYEEMAKRGWDVHLVVPARWRHEYGDREITSEALPSLAASFWPHDVAFAGFAQRHLYLTNPWRILRALQPDVVFLEQEPFSVVALQWSLAAYRLGIPFGVQAAENLDRRFPGPVRTSRSWVLGHAAFVAARSPTAATLARRWGARGHIGLVPHYVPGWPQRPRLRSDRFRVGYAGRLVPEKGLDVLVDAVRRLGGAVDLVVVGDGPLRGWLERQELGDARLVLLSGVSHNEMDAAYAQMDVLVLPSRTTSQWAEQFGRVLVEALWCDVAVVGSDSGEIPWVVKATGGGMVVPEGDSLVLVSALDSLRRDERGRASIAEAGRHRVCQLFSVNAVASAFDELLARCRPPDGRSRPGAAGPKRRSSPMASAFMVGWRARAGRSGRLTTTARPADRIDVQTPDFRASRVLRRSLDDVSNDAVVVSAERAGSGPRTRRTTPLVGLG